MRTPFNMCIMITSSYLKIKDNSLILKILLVFKYHWLSYFLRQFISIRAQTRTTNFLGLICLLRYFSISHPPSTQVSITLLYSPLYMSSRNFLSFTITVAFLVLFVRVKFLSATATSRTSVCLLLLIILPLDYRFCFPTSSHIQQSIIMYWVS